MNTDETAYLAELYRDLQDHGEVHAVVEEEDAELELRVGTTTIHFERDCVEIEGPHTTHIVGADRFIRHYRPMSVFDE